ncbi:unnamed protein product [Clonostachys byssicola]|uniref:Zn(2)-C6 fungal-type domain-containing protein n=1 Tax=Clonostachys byssicola TaxID=160290 RepID=A0A9N9UL58_9HYPO|nr:unnamed protein product [Clonostachys byssicola]
MSVETFANIGVALDFGFSNCAKPGPRLKRRRSPRACLVCRSRKVRCDVLQKSRPCTNCTLDGKVCIVPNGRRGKMTCGNGVDQPSLQHTEEATDPNNTSDHFERGVASDRDLSMGQHEFSFADEIDVDIGNALDDNGQAHDSDDWPQDTLCETQPNDKVVESPLKELWSHSKENHTELRNDAAPEEFLAITSPGSNAMELFAEREVSYTRYPFIILNNLRSLGPEDVAYLASQDCLVIPTGETLDHFLEMYFLHVHPLLPMINEGNFWKLYCHGPCEETDKVPLVLFQAILFAASSFVSEDVVKHLGFPHTRAARAAFYKRAKLLYNLETESSLVPLAQTALLLSFWAPDPLGGQGGLSDCTKNSTEAWLVLAIHDARNSGAHLQTNIPPSDPVGNDSTEQKHQNALRRLWWCCLIRDRILALNLRRNIQIKRAFYDPDTLYHDLSDEIHQSRVYNADTKRRTIQVLVQLARLATTLTDVIPLIYPSDDEPRYNTEAGKGSPGKKCKELLDSWYKSASSELSSLAGGADNLNPVILYTNFTYIYYYSAKIAVCHHEALQLALANASAMLDSIAFATICDNQQQLREAICGVSDCLERLIQLGLVRWLPVVTLACLALPLMLQILDVKISSMNRNSVSIKASKTQTTVKQRRLTVLIEAVRVYHPRYATVDYICKTIRHVTNLARLDVMSNVGVDTGMGQPIISDWTDFLILSPGHYLQLSNALDFSLKKTCLARADDISSDLKLLLGTGTKLPWPQEHSLTYQRLSPPSAFAIPGHSWDMESNEGSSSLSVPSQSNVMEESNPDETFQVSTSVTDRETFSWPAPERSGCELPPSAAIELGLDGMDFGGFPVLGLGPM